MTGNPRRILALVLSQGMVLFVLCWAGQFRSFSSAQRFWTMLLALGFVFFFVTLARLVRSTPEDLPWN